MRHVQSTLQPVELDLGAADRFAPPRLLRQRTISLATERVHTEVIAGWVSVLMCLKAAVDFGVDLRAHDPEKHWDNGYVEN
jgi:hypothetical protein